METIEKKIEEIKTSSEELKPLEIKEVLYKGLVKIEEGVYRGPTSIKYWM